MMGDRIRSLRRDKGITMKQLGNLLMLGESTISMYETGKRSPDHNTVKKIANYFNVSTDYLLGSTDDPTPPGKKLVVPEAIKNTYFAFHRGEFEDLTQEEVDALAVIAKRFKANRKGE